MDNNEINAWLFCSLHNFFARYLMMNCFVPGQVEKYITLCNINHYPLKELPISMFKQCARELGGNYVDYNARQVVVNLTWV